MTTSVETAIEIRDEVQSNPQQSPSGEHNFKIARIVLLGGLLAVPLALGAVLPWAWGAIALLSAVVLILWAKEQFARGLVIIAWSPLYVPCALFLLVAALQFWPDINQDRTGAREALLKLVTNFLLLFLAAQLFSHAPKSVWRVFVGAVTVFMFVLSVFAVLQYFSSGGLIYWTIQTASKCAFGPYANHNHYAGLMEMLIPITTLGILGRRDPAPFRAFSAFAVVVGLASVFLSGSRGGFIALLAEAGILSVILVRGSSRIGFHTGWVAVLMGLAASLTLFFLIDSGQVAKRLATIAEIPAHPEATFAERWVVSRDSARMIADNPWIGVGLGSFAIAYPPYQTFATDLLWDHAHNDYVEAVAETGAVGGALIVAALILFFRLAFGHIRERLQHEIGWIQTGAAVGCCGLLIHGLGDFNFHIPANAAWFAVCAAMATVPVCSDREPAAMAVGDCEKGVTDGLA